MRILLRRMRGRERIRLTANMGYNADTQQRVALWPTTANMGYNADTQQRVALWPTRHDQQ